MSVVAAIQMKGRVADLEYNLDHVAELIQEALRYKPKVLALPEFFTTPIVQDERLWSCALPPENAALDLLREIAIDHKVLIGGSYMEKRGEDVYNCYVLAHPDGVVTRHDKDMPTMIENAYMVGGTDDGVHKTPLGKVGTAMCWEMIRTQTVRRLSGRIDFLMTGSHWWAPPIHWMLGKKFFNDMSAMNEAYMLEAPSTLAKLLGVANIHAAHVGPLEGTIPLMPHLRWAPPFSSYLLGETQIVDASGTVLKRLSAAEGPGVIAESLDLAPASTSISPPHQYWIPDLAPRFRFFWWQQNLCAKKLYQQAKAQDQLRTYPLEPGE